MRNDFRLSRYGKSLQAICRPRRRRVVGSSPTWGAIVGAKFALLRLIFFCKPVKISRPPAALLLLSEKRLARRAFFRWCERTVLARFFLFCFLNCTCVTAASGSPKSDSFLGRGEIHTWSEQSPKEHCLGGLLIAAPTRCLVKQHHFYSAVVSGMI